MKRSFNLLQYVWRRHGLTGLIPLLIHNAAHYVRQFRRYSSKKTADAFDGQYGIETSGVSPISSLDVIQQPNAIYASGYYPSSAAQVKELIEKIDIDLSGFIFIDFGSGKGRALLVAAQFPFREVIGVEFSYELHEIALSNISRFPMDQCLCGKITSVLGDAATFDLPASDLVCYFYHPFGPEILAQVLQNLAVHIAQGYRIIVIYTNPVYRDVFDQSGLFLIVEELPDAIVLTDRSQHLLPRGEGSPRGAATHRGVRACRI